MRPLHRPLFAGGRVHVRDAGGLALGVAQHLARHGAGDNRQLAGLHRRRQQHGGRLEVRVRGAAATALRAVMARGAPVQRPGQDREPRRHTGNLQPVGRLLEVQLVRTRQRRRLELAVGLVVQAGLGRVIGPEDPDKLVELVVVGLDVVVGEGPVVAEAIHAAAPEVIGAPAQRDAAPVIGAAAEHAGPEPVELRAGRRGVRLPFQLPAAPGRVELAKRPFGRRTTARRLVGPAQHLAIAGLIPLRTGFQHADLGASFGEHLGGHPAASARSDDDDVVDLRRTDDLHVERPRCETRGRRVLAVYIADRGSRIGHRGSRIGYRVSGIGDRARRRR